MSCGPFQVQVGGGARSRGKSARFSCLGGRAADEEAGVPRSELEQRYAKVSFVPGHEEARVDVA